MTSMPASRNARATTLAPRSCPSRPGFATTTRIRELIRRLNLPDRRAALLNDKCALTDGRPGVGRRATSATSVADPVYFLEYYLLTRKTRVRLKSNDSPVLPLVRRTSSPRSCRTRLCHG